MCEELAHEDSRQKRRRPGKPWKTGLSAGNIECEEEKLGLRENRRSIYRTWEADLRSFIRSQRLKERWDELKPYYQPAFVRHVEALQQNKRPTERCIEK